MPSFTELAEPITARDIRRFDAEAKQLVADFQTEGWRGYLSSQGHAIMLAPDGITTASVSGHSDGIHKARAARADLRKWLRAQGRLPGAPKPETTKNGASKNGAAHRSPHRTPKLHPGLELTGDTERPYRCADPACKDRPPFKGAGAAILHRQRIHDGLVCKDCGETFPLKSGSVNAKAYSQHRQEKHGAKAPKKSARLKPNEDGVFPCEWCGRPFPSPQGRAGHHRTHTGESKPATPPVWQEPTDVEQAEPGTVDEPADEPAQPEPAALPDVEQEADANKVDALDVDNLDAFIAGEDPGKLLTMILAVVAPPLVGEIERLRAERNALRTRVTELEQAVEEHQARLSLFKEVLGA